MRIYLNRLVSIRMNNTASLMEAPAMGEVPVAQHNTTNKQMEELTMTTNTNNTIEAVEPTMTAEEMANAIIADIKADNTTTATKALSMDGIKGMINKAWSAVKGYDYKGAIVGAYNKVLDAAVALDQWCSTTKTGKAVAYTVKATSYLFVAGLFTHGAIGAILGGALMLTAADVFFASKRPSLKDAAKSYAINVALMTGMTAVAWVVFPLVVNVLTWMYYTAVAGVILPLASVVL